MERQDINCLAGLLRQDARPLAPSARFLVFATFLTSIVFSHQSLGSNGSEAITSASTVPAVSAAAVPEAQVAPAVEVPYLADVPVTAEVHYESPPEAWKTGEPLIYSDESKQRIAAYIRYLVVRD